MDTISPWIQHPTRKFKSRTLLLSQVVIGRHPIAVHCGKLPSLFLSVIVTVICGYSCPTCCHSFSNNTLPILSMSLSRWVWVDVYDLYCLHYLFVFNWYIMSWTLGKGVLAGLEKVQMSYPYGVPFHKYQDVIRSKTFKSVYEWVMNTDTYYIIAGSFYQNVLY